MVNAVTLEDGRRDKPPTRDLRGLYHTPIAA
jgi:hypothetical protein